MTKIVGRLIGFLFAAVVCAAGPILLVIALITTTQRTVLILGGEQAEGTVVAKQSSPGRSHPTFAPVFEFKATDGQSYTVTSDVSGREADFRFGEHVRVLYRASNPQAARIDAFGQLWTLPLVSGAVGAAFSSIPALVLVSWLRRRSVAAGLHPSEAMDQTGGASRGMRAVLGVLLTGGGLAMFAFGVLGVPADSNRVTESRVIGSLIGVLLVSCGVLIAQWVPVGSRRQNALGAVAIMSMALIFGWVALFGEDSGFAGGVAIGGVAVGSSGHVTPARIAFGFGSVLFALASLPAWREVFRSAHRP